MGSFPFDISYIITEICNLKQIDTRFHGKHFLQVILYNLDHLTIRWHGLSKGYYCAATDFFRKSFQRKKVIKGYEISEIPITLYNLLTGGLFDLLANRTQ